jgi:hypothetical protein
MMSSAAPVLGPRAPLGDPLYAFDGPALQHHVRRCAAARGPWFGLRCVVEALHAFLMPRPVTTLTLAACAFGIANSLMA